MPISLQSHIPRTYRIKEVHQLTEMVRVFTFDGSLGAKPGQLVMVWLPGVDEVPLSVAYDDGAVTKVAFFAVGDMTAELAKCNAGDLVGLRGPFGTHYDWKPGQHIALVAGGYGAAPMYFVASQAVHNGCTLDVILGARDKEHVFFVDELSALPNTAVHVCTDDGSVGFQGYNTAVLETMLNAMREKGDTGPIDQIFACGPEPMLKRVSEIAAAYKIPSQIAMARYMKCGYGLCGNCTVDPLGIRICTEGPVVKNDLCMQIKEFGSYKRDSLGRKEEMFVPKGPFKN